MTRYDHMPTAQLIKEIRERELIPWCEEGVRYKKEALAKRDPQEVAEGYAQLLREELMKE